jgi:hypothetical protein
MFWTRWGTPAGRRYVFRFAIAMAAYMVFLQVSVRAIDAGTVEGALRYLLALMPALPVLAVIVIMGLYLLEEDDEFRRMKTVQAILGGLGVVLAVSTAWGFLEELADVPRLPLYLVFPIFAVGMAVATPIVEWRYR